MLIAAIVMLGGVCYKFLIHDPQQAAYTSLIQERDTAAAELTRNERILATADAVHREYDRLTAFIATMEAKLPATKDIPPLLTAMEQFTRKLGIKFDSIQPSVLSPVTDSASGGAKTPGGSKALPYSRMEVRLSLTGTYAQLVQYVHDLRDFPRLIVVDSITLGPQKLPLLSASVVSEIYTVQASSAATADAPAGGSSPASAARPSRNAAPNGAVAVGVPAPVSPVAPSRIPPVTPVNFPGQP
jgi:Tfp pilus assembly protein PilO